MTKFEEIKKRHESRKRMLQKRKSNTRPVSTNSRSAFYSPSRKETDSPVIRSQAFVFKCLIAACLVLVAGIVFKQPAVYGQATKMVERTLTYELNFAKVSAWYKEAFGEPLALLPGVENDEPVEGESMAAFSMPVNGQATVTKEFSEQSKGVIVQTKPGTTVTAVKSGYVADIVEKSDIGTTVIISHLNGQTSTESWYGKLKDVNVKLYEFVKKGQKIGTVSKSDNGKHGLFYFALKEDKQFIDPIQVIQFD